MQRRAEDPAAVAHARRMGVEWWEAVRIERGELAGHAGIVRLGVSARETGAGDDRPMNTTKPEPKKARAPRKPYRKTPARPMYPESYAYAKGPRSSWRSNERNA